MALPPRELLDHGADVLRPLMERHGFAFQGGGEGRGSGGAFARGAFRRGDRALELWVRGALGRVRYHAGGESVSHGVYMEELGRRQARFRLAGEDLLDDFRYLREDLERWGGDFLEGGGEVLRSAAGREAAEESARRLAILSESAGDLQARALGRAMFRQGRWDEAARAFASVRHPELLADPERRMWEVARRRSGG